MLFEDPTTYKVPVPKSAAEFEDICADLWREEWNDPHIQRIGRPGQRQDGLDVLSDPRDGPRRAIQCKNYEPKLFTNAIVDDIVEKVKGSPLLPIEELVIATTAPRSTTVQEHAKEIRERHRKTHLFDVWVWAWEDIETLLQRHQDVLHRHLASSLPGSSGLYEIVGETFLENVTELERQRKFQDAMDLINSFEQKQQTMDDNMRYRVLSTQGRLLWEMSRPQDAAGKLIQAYQLNKTHEGARTNAAQAYLWLGDRESAAQMARDVIKSNPANALAYEILIMTTLNLEEARARLAEVPEDYRMTSGVQLALGLLAEQEPDLAAAEDYFRVAQNGGSARHFEIAAQLAAVILTRIARDAFSRGETVLKADSTRQVEEAEQLLSSAIDHPGDNSDETLVWWNANRCLARLYRGNTQGASEDADFCTGACPGRPEYARLLAMVKDRLGDKKGSLSVLRGVTDFTSIPDALELKIELLEDEKAYDEALAAVADYISLPERPWTATAIAEYTRLRLLQLLGRASEARSRLKELQDNESENPLLFLAAYALYESTESASPAADKDNLLKTAATLAVKDGVEAVIREKVGAALFNLSRYEYSVLVDRIGVTGDVYDARTRRLLTGYLHLGKTAEALKVCIRLVDSGADNYEVLFYRGQLYSRMGDLTSAESDLQRCLVMSPRDINALLLLVETQLRLERDSDARNSLQQLDDFDALSPVDFKRIVGLWIRVGDPQKALDIAYAILISDRNRMQSEAYETYVWSVFAVERVAPELIPQFETSREGTGLRLKTDANIEARYVIGDGPRQVGRVILLGPSDPLAHSLSGAKVGDVLDLGAGGFGAKHRATVLEVKSKYLIMMDAAMEFIQTAFPESAGIEMIPVFKSDESGEMSDSLRERIQGMGEYGAHARRMMDMQEKGQLPFSAVCSLLSRDVVAMRLEIALSGGTYVRADVPGTKPNADSDAFSSLVLDPMSVLTFASCPALSSGIPSKWLPVYTQSTLDALRNARLELGLATKTGLHSVASADGVHLSPSEVPPETVKSWTAAVDNAIGWLRRHARREPYAAVLDLGNNTYETAVSSIGQPAIDSLALAGETHRVLVSDELALRRLAPGLKAQARTTQDVLFWMLTDALISRGDYGVNLVALYCSGLRGIYLDCETMTSICTSIGWEYKSVPKGLFEMLSPTNMWNEGPLVAGEFANQVCRHVASRQDRQLAWWPSLLSAVTAGRDPESSISAMLGRAKPLLRLLPLQDRELTEFSSAWPRARVSH